jgi:hypothetical protein
MNPFDHAEGTPGDFEIAIAFNSHSSHIHSHFFPFGHGSFDQIPSMEALKATWSFGATARESEFVYIDHLTRLSAFRLDEPGTHMLETHVFGCRGPDRCRIDPVHFGQPHPTSIPTSTPARSYLNGQAERFQFLIEPKPCRIDGCCVRQRYLDLSLDTGQQDWSVSQKDFDGLIGLRLVAGPTGDD